MAEQVATETADEAVPLPAAEGAPAGGGDAVADPAAPLQSSDAADAPSAGTGADSTAAGAAAAGEGVTEGSTSGADSGATDGGGDASVVKGTASGNVAVPDDGDAKFDDVGEGSGAGDAPSSGPGIEVAGDVAVVGAADGGAAGGGRGGDDDDAASVASGVSEHIDDTEDPVAAAAETAAPTPGAEVDEDIAEEVDAASDAGDADDIAAALLSGDADADAVAPSDPAPEVAEEAKLAAEATPESPKKGDTAPSDVSNVGEAAADETAAGSEAKAAAEEAPSAAANAPATKAKHAAGDSGDAAADDATADNAKAPEPDTPAKQSDDEPSSGAADTTAASDATSNGDVSFGAPDAASAAKPDEQPKKRRSISFDTAPDIVPATYEAEPATESAVPAAKTVKDRPPTPKVKLGQTFDDDDDGAAGGKEDGEPEAKHDAAASDSKSGADGDAASESKDATAAESKDAGSRRGSDVPSRRSSERSNPGMHASLRAQMEAAKADLDGLTTVPAASPKTKVSDGDGESKTTVAKTVTTTDATAGATTKTTVTTTTKTTTVTATRKPPLSKQAEAAQREKAAIERREKIAAEKRDKAAADKAAAAAQAAEERKKAEVAILEGPGTANEKLVIACKSGFLPAAQKLVEDHGADVSHHDGDGLSPLHHAAAAGHSKVSYYLIQQGADPKDATPDGKSPARIAHDAGHVDTRNMLKRLANSSRAVMASVKFRGGAVVRKKGSDRNVNTGASGSPNEGGQSDSKAAANTGDPPAAAAADGAAPSEKGSGSFKKIGMSIDTGSDAVPPAALLSPNRPRPDYVPSLDLTPTNLAKKTEEAERRKRETDKSKVLDKPDVTSAHAAAPAKAPSKAASTEVAPAKAAAGAAGNAEAPKKSVLKSALKSSSSTGSVDVADGKGDALTETKPVGAVKNKALDAVGGAKHKRRVTIGFVEPPAVKDAQAGEKLKKRLPTPKHGASGAGAKPAAASVGKEGEPAQEPPAAEKRVSAATLKRQKEKELMAQQAAREKPRARKSKPKIDAPTVDEARSQVKDKVKSRAIELIEGIDEEEKGKEARLKHHHAHHHHHAKKGAKATGVSKSASQPAVGAAGAGGGKPLKKRHAGHKSASALAGGGTDGGASEDPAVAVGESDVDKLDPKEAQKVKERNKLLKKHSKKDAKDDGTKDKHKGAKKSHGKHHSKSGGGSSSADASPSAKGATDKRRKSGPEVDEEDPDILPEIVRRASLPVGVSQRSADEGSSDDESGGDSADDGAGRLPHVGGGGGHGGGGKRKKQRRIRRKHKRRGVNASVVSIYGASQEALLHRDKKERRKRREHQQHLVAQANAGALNGMFAHPGGPREEDRNVGIFALVHSDTEQHLITKGKGKGKGHVVHHHHIIHHHHVGPAPVGTGTAGESEFLKAEHYPTVPPPAVKQTHNKDGEGSGYIVVSGRRDSQGKSPTLPQLSPDRAAGISTDASVPPPQHHEPPAEPAAHAYASKGHEKQKAKGKGAKGKKKAKKGASVDATHVSLEDLAAQAERRRSHASVAGKEDEEDVPSQSLAALLKQGDSNIVVMDGGVMPYGPIPVKKKSKKKMKPKGSFKGNKTGKGAGKGKGGGKGKSKKAKAGRGAPGDAAEPEPDLSEYNYDDEKTGMVAGMIFEVDESDGDAGSAAASDAGSEVKLAGKAAAAEKRKYRDVLEKVEDQSAILGFVPVGDESAGHYLGAVPKPGELDVSSVDGGSDEDDSDDDADGGAMQAAVAQAASEVKAEDG